MAGDFDFLHIKQRTAGSSNELSFDVLDHRRSEADGKSARVSRMPKIPSFAQGSYHGVAGTSALSGQAEVKKRKKVRHFHRLRFQIVCVVAVVALVAAAVYAGLQLQEQHAGFSGRVGGLVSRLAETDGTLVEIDALMADPLDEAQAERRAKALDAMPQASTELNRISVDAQALASAALNEKDELAVSQVNDAARYRASMLAAASRAFGEANEMRNQVARANEIWNDVLNADQLAREAGAIANKASTQEATQQALDETREARDSFVNDLADLQSMSSQFGVDFSEQERYLNKRIESLDYAVETGEALLAGNREAATAANEAYNAADVEAARLAEALPLSMTELVQNCFEQDIATCQREYDETRALVIQVDSNIRDYLAQQ